MKFHNKIFGWEYSWQEFANELQGSVELDEKETPALKRLSVPLETSIIMHAVPNPRRQHTHAETIVWSEYLPQNDFTINIHTEKWTDHVTKLLGSHKIAVGDARIDSRFHVQSSDRLRAIELFGSEELRSILLSFHDMNLRHYSANEKLPHGHHVSPGKHALCFTQEKLAQSFEELVGIQRLFKLIMAEFVRAEPSSVRHQQSFAERFAER